MYLPNAIRIDDPCPILQTESREFFSRLVSIITFENDGIIPLRCLYYGNHNSILRYWSWTSLHCVLYNTSEGRVSERRWGSDPERGEREREREVYCNIILNWACIQNKLLLSTENVIFLEVPLKFVHATDDVWNSDDVFMRSWDTIT